VHERRLRPRAPVDLAATLAPLQRGRHDPCTRVRPDDVWRATRTPCGPVTTRIVRDRDDVVVRAWGPGESWALERVETLLGLDDDATDFVPRDGLVAELHRRNPGLRLGASGAVVEAAVASVVEQRVTSIEAHRSYARLVRRYGERAPGPAGAAGLMVPPAPERLRSLPYWAFHPLGIERRRADTIRRLCARATSLERIGALDAHDAQRALRCVDGVGPWTAAEVASVALGDRDAVSVGDYHLPGIVSWSLAGERDGDDARMLELLEPYRPQRARVIRLLMRGGSRPPRRAPRARLRAIEGI
jgi:3-methyladenine DNA glycosylase/8-oxoguanine DNA glycosylase